MFKLGSLAPGLYVCECVCVLLYEVPQQAWTLPLSDLQTFLSLSHCLSSVSFSFTLGEWRDLKAHNETVEPALPVGHQCVCACVYVCFITLMQISQCLDIVWQKHFPSEVNDQ